MNQLEVLRESLGQCDEIILDALLMRNRIVEDIMLYKEAKETTIYCICCLVQLCTFILYGISG